MKKLFLYISFLIAFSFIATSCSDFMDVASTTTVDTNSAVTDTVYPLFGVLTKFQNLAEKYVVLGELRGELMTTTTNSDDYLRQIENYDVSSDNPYADVTPYYEVINNCNNILNDTSLAHRTSKKYANEYATVSLIRAWTYLQVGINYNKALYLQKPVLNVDDLPATGSSMLSFKDLVDQLISDVAFQTTTTSIIPTYAVAYSCPQRNFILGELYMWKATLQQENEIASATPDSLKTSKSFYQTAAGYYKAIIQNDGSLSANTDMYKLSTLFGGTSWSTIFSYTRSNTALSNEVLWMIIFDQNSGNYNNLKKLFSNTSGDYKLKPSDYVINLWNTQKLSTGKIGDYRGQNGSWASVSGVPVVQKYLYNKTQFSDNAEVYLARASMVYLRYAEAVNRCGKPMLALTALKYGLNKTNMLNYVPTAEKTPSAGFINFDDVRYDFSKGVRGRALIEPSTLIVPNFKWDATNPAKSKNDSINYVEDAILQEYALETAFEGNRWADCMRVAIRRDNSGEYMYSLLAQKQSNANVADKLKVKTNWYLPFPEK